MEDAAGTKEGACREIGALQSSEGSLPFQEKDRRPGRLIGQYLPLFNWALVSQQERPCTRCRSGP